MRRVPFLPDRGGPPYFLAKILFLGLGCAAMILAAYPIQAADLECASSIAWATKVRRGERRRLLVKAQEEATQQLAKRSSEIGSVLERVEEERRIRGNSNEGGSFTEDQEMWRTSATRYEVDGRLRGYQPIFRGDKERMEVVYCVPEAVFRAIKNSVEGRRRARISDFQRRFADLENLMSDEPLDQERAQDAFHSLSADVIAERLWDESFTSQRTGLTASFGSTLEQYGQILRDTRAHVDRCIGEAKKEIASGHLQKAEHNLNEAASLDRGLRGGYIDRLHSEIVRLRNQRITALRDAERLSSVGRHGAAERRIQDARQIDQDDQDSLARTRQIIDRNHDRFLRANPTNSWALEIAIGSLGIDEGVTADQAENLTGRPVEGNAPFSFKLEYRRALGRHGEIAIGGSWGYSTATRDSSSFVEDGSFLDYAQATLGIGLKTVRRSPGGGVLRLMGGPAWEWGSLRVIGLAGRETSDSRVGWFARASFQWSLVEIFAQKGFGFAERAPSTNSLVGWSDRAQVGVGFVF